MRKKKIKNGVGKLKAPRLIHLMSRNLFFTYGKILAYCIDGKQENLS